VSATTENRALLDAGSLRASYSNATLSGSWSSKSFFGGLFRREDWLERSGAKQARGGNQWPTLRNFRLAPQCLINGRAKLKNRISRAHLREVAAHYRTLTVEHQAMEIKELLISNPLPPVEGSRSHARSSAN